MMGDRTQSLIERAIVAHDNHDGDMGPKALAYAITEALGDIVRKPDLVSVGELCSVHYSPEAEADGVCVVRATDHHVTPGPCIFASGYLLLVVGHAALSGDSPKEKQ